jgi:AcrR family transcriptional regulator
MKPNRRTQAERSKGMRARLSQAAYEIIAERGHSGFRTAMVAARADVSQGALLHHFPSKDAVTLAAIEYALALAKNAAAIRLAKKTRTPKSTFAAMIGDFRHFFGTDAFWVALDITMDASKNRTLAPAIRRVVADYRRPIYAAWAARLVALGWSSARAEKSVRMTAALVTGMAIRTLWSDADADEAIIREWLPFLLAADRSK